MRAFLVVAAVVGMVASAASVGFSQAKPSTAPSLEGVWRATSVIATGPNAGNSIPARPFNMNIWTKRYYSGINEDADMGVRIRTGNLGTVPPNSELVFSNGNNTMVQTAKSADGKSETRRTYTRLEEKTTNLRVRCPPKAMACCIFSETPISGPSAIEEKREVSAHRD
jgi:hypothetical protein